MGWVGRFLHAFLFIYKMLIMGEIVGDNGCC